MLADHWYYRLDGRPRGPFTLAQFEKLVRGQAVALDTEVSTDGRTWKPLHEALADAPFDPAPPTNNTDWMNAPTLLPGDPALRLKPDPKPPA